MADEAKRRINILSFWEKHGLKATLDAFGTKRRICLYRSHGRQGGQYRATPLVS